MTFILVILTLVVIISVEWFRTARKKSEDQHSEVVTEYPSLVGLLDRYFHPGHTWAMISGPRSVTVGSDDFSAGVIGTLSAINLPKVGEKVRQGEPIAFLHSGTRILPQWSPVSGKIVEVNAALSLQPALLNDSPYDRGWIARINPVNLELDLRSLLKGIVADSWREAVRSEIIQMFSPNVGAVLQDGGQLVRDIGNYCTDENWDVLVHKFFSVVDSRQIQSKPTN